MAHLRIAVVGSGLIGKCHMTVLRQHPDTQLCAVIDPAPEADIIARQEGVPHYLNLPAFLAQITPHDRPDAIILATPNALHVSGALACLDAGIAVLIEKPVADTLADADALIAAQRRTNVPVLVGHHRRHSSIIRNTKAVIESGTLGKIVTFTGTALFYKPDTYFDSAPWRSVAGGGPVLINLIHEIDSLRYLLGEVVQVQAMTSNAIRHFAVEDTAAIVLRFASGTLATFTLSDTTATPRSWEQTAGENPAYAHYPQEGTCLSHRSRCDAKPARDLGRHCCGTRRHNNHAIASQTA
jgi:predicted dehydrogenase